MDAASITGKSYGKWSYDSVENPKGKLEKDSFLKLFLTELKYQDPTEPMDNEKILTQTSQLTQLEAQEEQKKAMKKIVENFNKNSKFQAQYSLVPAIGKMARTTLDYVNINTGDKKSSFELYFDKPIKNGKIFIKDEKKNIVKIIDLEKYKDDFNKSYIGSKGVKKFTWNNNDNNGKKVKEGKYTITASYTDNIKDENKLHEIALGSMPIESVKFENGITYLKLGSQYIDAKELKEIR
jgi:flagellar basal-body rod modification protein FlgD